jgi:hypothetical protein
MAQVPIDVHPQQRTSQMARTEINFAVRQEAHYAQRTVARIFNISLEDIRKSASVHDRLLDLCPRNPQGQFGFNISRACVASDLLHCYYNVAHLASNLCVKLYLFER